MKIVLYNKMTDLRTRIWHSFLDMEFGDLHIIDAGVSSIIRTSCDNNYAINQFRYFLRLHN